MVPVEREVQRPQNTKVKIVEHLDVIRFLVFISMKSSLSLRSWLLSGRPPGTKTGEEKWEEKCQRNKGGVTGDLTTNLTVLEGPHRLPSDSWSFTDCSFPRRKTLTSIINETGLWNPLSNPGGPWTTRTGENLKGRKNLGDGLLRPYSWLVPTFVSTSFPFRQAHFQFWIFPVQY